MAGTRMLRWFLAVGLLGLVIGSAWTSPGRADQPEPQATAAAPAPPAPVVQRRR